MRVKKEFTIDFSHRLKDYEGACRNIHWHTYRVIIFLHWTRQPTWNEKGMVIDFGYMKEIAKQIENEFDHKYVYENEDGAWHLINEAGFETKEVNYRPTAENLSADFAIKVKNFLANKNKLDNINTIEVEVYETPTSSAKAMEII